MCLGGAPKAPEPLPQRQPAKAPDASLIASRVSDVAKRRMGFAATILTPSQLGPAATTGKMLLGA